MRFLFSLLFLCLAASAAVAQPAVPCTPENSFVTGLPPNGNFFINPASQQLPGAESNVAYEESFGFAAPEGIFPDLGVPLPTNASVQSMELTSVTGLPSGWSFEVRSGNTLDNTPASTTPVTFNDPGPATGPYGCFTIYGTTGCVDEADLENGNLVIRFSFDIAIDLSGFPFPGLPSSIPASDSVVIPFTNGPGCPTGGGNLTVDGSVDDATPCPGQSFTLSASGADSYEWFEGSLQNSIGSAVSLTLTRPAGSYTFYVEGTETNTGNTGLDTVTVDVQGIDFTLDVSDISCNGETDGSILVASVLTGSSPFEYGLDGNFGNAPAVGSDLSAGTYTVTVRDAAGCETDSTVTISEPDPLAQNPTLTSPSDPNTDDGSISLSPSGGTPPYSLSWSTGDTASTVNGLGYGDYTVTLTDANGCTRVVEYSLSETSGLVPELASAIRVYPNPAQTELFVELSEALGQTARVQLVSLTGQVVLQADVRRQTELNIAAVPAGCYVLKIHTEAGSFARRIIVQ